jgi:N-[(2S)-2-amino-2-carboxyethyl]-L-glutamate dehydrogenase
MLYLNSAHLEGLGTNWSHLISVIENSVRTLNAGNYSQPIKPYLRYGDVSNRIIAMPAYLGGETSMAGIKWIASFPGNIEKNMARAHSITILNDQNSGKPLCMINANLVSAVRTAAVSGLITREYIRTNAKDKKITVGIIGFGPIGRTHLKMIEAVAGGQIDRIYLYDLKTIQKDSIDCGMPEKVIVAGSWQECYDNADIFITCTVSDQAYIDHAPKKGSLQLNVSLRDYKTATRKYMDVIIVDDWDEVCRQNTDIENMHKNGELQKEDTISIADVVCLNSLNNIKKDDTVYKSAVSKESGIVLPD